MVAVLEGVNATGQKGIYLVVVGNISGVPIVEITVGLTIVQHAATSSITMINSATGVEITR